MKPIAVFDSGLGGLSVLRHLLAAYPHEDFVYLADSAHAPYGPRPAAEVRALCRGHADYFVRERGAKLVVIACNTATVAAVADLRQRYPDTPFVAMEPAVKPAAAATRSGTIGVMATAGTIGSDKYARLLHEYGQDVRVLEDPCLGLVDLIEAGHLDDDVLRRRVREIVRPMVAAGADTIVLGCTHFPLVAGAIGGAAGEGVALVDPGPAVARQVGRLLRRGGLADARGATGGSLELRTTGELGRFRENVARVLGESYGLVLAHSAGTG